MRRGDLYRVQRPAGDPKRQRTFVVVSRQSLIDSRFSTVICAPIFSTGEGLSTQVPVGPEQGLKHSSWIMCDNLVSLRKSELTQFVGSLPEARLMELEEALKMALEIRLSRDFDGLLSLRYPQYSPMAGAAISVQNLYKSYGAVQAVRGVDFEIQTGEVFGLLGPNGAGKTTTVEILEGLRPRTSGEVRVLGFDPEKQKQQLKDRIGVCLQATNMQDKIRVREAMHIFSCFYTRSVDADALLKRLQLDEKRDAFYATLSGGQKQRLALALALLNDPALLFLDEPTTGLDPQVRAEIHALLEELRNEKRTILLTTHYIEEAERLCDRVAIVDQGRIIAIGTPRQLQQQSRAGVHHRCDLRQGNS